MASEIYTVGHSNIESKKFIDILKHNNIETLVDVRSAPYSKYASQFNKENIKRELEKEGIKYIFMGDVLGGRSFHVADIIADAKYSEIMKMDWYRDGISRLIELANTDKVAIMCSEENPGKCHRHLLIAQSLLSRGVGVLHIRGNGSIEVAKKYNPQATLF